MCTSKISKKILFLEWYLKNLETTALGKEDSFHATCAETPFETCLDIANFKQQAGLNYC